EQDAEERQAPLRARTERHAVGSVDVEHGLSRPHCAERLVGPDDSSKGAGPPSAQSSSCTVCTTGIFAADASCTMQPMLPVATTSAFVRAMCSILRSRKRSAISG